MARIITNTVYQYDELSESAQARARDWFRELQDASDFEHVIDDADRMLSILGFSVDRHSVRTMGGSTIQKPAIYWSLGYCQSDGAWIEATYAYAAGASKAIRAEAPQDTKLHRIADALQAMQKPYRYRITARVKDNDRGPMQIEIEPDGADVPAVVDTLRLAVRDLERWIYAQLRAEDEYQSADEQVAETIRANEYEFTEDGKRA